jgi:hypothetical protein
LAPSDIGARVVEEENFSSGTPISRAMSRRTRSGLRSHLEERKWRRIGASAAGGGVAPSIDGGCGWVDST